MPNQNNSSFGIKLNRTFCRSYDSWLAAERDSVVRAEKAFLSRKQEN